MSGSTPVRISDPIYPHDYYLPSELKLLRGILLDSEITGDFRTFLRGRTFSRPRGTRRFVTQLQSPDRWKDDEGTNIPFGMECARMYNEMFCVPREELAGSSSEISRIIFKWRSQIKK
jgi:hypothetical protein